MECSSFYALNPFELCFSCKGSKVSCCSGYKHKILPKRASGKNINSCIHVRRLALTNPDISEVIYTSNGLRLRLNEKGIEKIKKKYKGQALKIIFKNKTKCIDGTCKFVCCPCVCCGGCCNEMKSHELLIPDHAYIGGTDVSACLGVCFSAFITRLFCSTLLLCSGCCDNTLKLEHTDYELVDFEGDFIAPFFPDMERSTTKGPASPRSQHAQQNFTNISIQQ